ncbi:RHS repeat-associated core domain-containing protein [Chryseobacterium indoltheticum]|uniref:RHS repeat-associated core domain-containing protein n=1 Tax=Chryseobacterium indoltheticum TaxID=254 RepID=UPI001F262DF5|nr:RHS repeat-associated core domain-containing protein [Chryseobacterium indoltheticum]
MKSNNSPYKFNGKELDAETGYYYYGARYYNPRVSLWLNVDPLAEKMPSWSPYVYTFNNPINLVDPDGMAPMPPDIITKVINQTTYKSNGYTSFNRDLSITLTMAIYNPENLDLSHTAFAAGQGTINVSSFRGPASDSYGKFVQNDNIKNLNIVYKVVTDLKDIPSQVHVMTVTSGDILPNSGSKLNPIGKAEKGGRVGAVEYTKNGFNSLVLHEIGHWFGLDDGYDTGNNQYPNENTNTIMDCHGCTTNKWKVTTKQRATISLSSDLGIGPATSTGNVYKKSKSGTWNKTSIQNQVINFNRKNIK